MKIFLSWSGERSRLLAEILHAWLPKVIQSIEPWMSSSDIEKGDQWLLKISEKLKTSHYGIICLTSENVNASWILFEAGALSSAIDKSNVCPILLDFAPSLLSGPLSQFQATKFKKTDVFELLKSINKNIEFQKLSDNQLKETFDVWWPKLEAGHPSILVYNFSEVYIHFLSENPLHPLQRKRKVLTTLGLK